MLSKPGVLLRIEGAALFAIVLYLYHSTGAGWGLFLLLFLWSDLFMLGYLSNVRLGAPLLQPCPYRRIPRPSGGSVLSSPQERIVVICTDLAGAH